MTLPKRTGEHRGGRRSVYNSSTSPRSIKFREVACRALEYRRLGYTYDQIAQELGVSASHIARTIKWGMDQIITEPASDLKKMMTLRLEGLLSGVLDRAFGGDSQAQEQARRTIDQLARLHGLYQPNRIEHSGDMPQKNIVFKIWQDDLAL